MSSATTIPNSTAGKLFFVSGLTGGREVFLGKAIDEPFQDHLTLEGKVLSMTPQNRMVVRPFHTTVNFSLLDRHYSVQHISNTKAHDEASNLLSLSATHVSRTAYPYVHRWVEAAMQSSIIDPPAASSPAEKILARAGADPFCGFFENFQATAEEFRRALFQSIQVESTRELDRVTELEGDLLIEIGKLTNQAAVKLNQVLTRERELSQHFEAFQGAELPLGNAGLSMSGWPFLFERLQIAKTWARKNGKAALVRELNAVLKDAIFALNEVVLDHVNSLDTLITETFSQYGITYELTGDSLAHGEPLVPARPTASSLGAFVPAAH